MKINDWEYFRGVGGFANPVGEGDFLQKTPF